MGGARKKKIKKLDRNQIAIEKHIELQNRLNDEKIAKAVRPYFEQGFPQVIDKGEDDVWRHVRPLFYELYKKTKADEKKAKLKNGRKRGSEDDDDDEEDEAGRTYIDSARFRELIQEAEINNEEAV